MREEAGKDCHMRRKIFTLIELLIAIGIMALLVSILMPALQQARMQAIGSNCASNLKQVGNGFMMYADDFNGVLPIDSASFVNQFNPNWINVYWIHYFSYNYLGGTTWDYTYSRGVFLCPADKSPNRFQGVGYSYGINLSASEQTPQLMRFVSPSAVYLAGDGQSYLLGLVNNFVQPEYRHRNGVNMLFADGHVSWIKYSLPLPGFGYNSPWYGYTP